MPWLSFQEISQIRWINTEEAIPFKVFPACDCWKISIPELQGHVKIEEEILNSNEIERAQRYFQEKDRVRFKLSRISLRILLSRYLQLDPADLVFRDGPNNKPFIDGGLHFNVSHSEEMILIAVSRKQVGVDVEKLQPRISWEDLITEIACAEELSMFKESPNKIDFFYYLWTRKESLLKASSKGLEDSLNQLNVLDGKRILPAGIIGSNQDWLINSFRMHEGYRGCIASSFTLKECRFLDAGGVL